VTHTGGRIQSRCTAPKYRNRSDRRPQGEMEAGRIMGIVVVTVDSNEVGRTRMGPPDADLFPVVRASACIAGRPTGRFWAC